jgi:hypothetical protein
LDKGHLPKNIARGELRQNGTIPAPHFGVAGQENEKGVRPIAGLEERRAAWLLADGSER